MIILRLVKLLWNDCGNLNIMYKSDEELSFIIKYYIDKCNDPMYY